MKEQLLRLERRLEGVKQAPMFAKAQAAELALQDALALMRTMADRIEALENGNG